MTKSLLLFASITLIASLSISPYIQPALASHELSGTITVDGHVHPLKDGTPVGGFTISVVDSSSIDQGVVKGVLSATVLIDDDPTGALAVLEAEPLSGQWILEPRTDKIFIVLANSAGTVKINLMGIANDDNLPFEGTAFVPNLRPVHLIGTGSINAVPP